MVDCMLSDEARSNQSGNARNSSEAEWAVESAYRQVETTSLTSCCRRTRYSHQRHSQRYGNTATQAQPQQAPRTVL